MASDSFSTNLVLCIFLLSITSIGANNLTNSSNVINVTSTTASTTYYPMASSTMFHTTSDDKYFILLNIKITFQCDHNDTNIICPNLQNIEEIFKNTLNEMENILSSYDIDKLDYDNNDENVIIIHVTIYTNNDNDFNALQEYIQNTNFTQSLQDNLEQNNIDIINVQSEIIETGINNDDDDDDDDNDNNKSWYKAWIDPLNYSVFQWVVVSIILFFLLLCIIGCLWWFCCRNKVKGYEKDGFMNNPHRYDSEFPGAEMQSFSTTSHINLNKVNYVE